MQNDQGCFGIPLRSSPARSEIYLDTGNGFGSTNTAVRRFSNVRQSYGTAISYTDSATLGASFTINVPGLYFVYYSDSNSGGASRIGISVNLTAFSTVAFSLSYLTGLRAVGNNETAGGVAVAVFAGFLNRGDIVRPVGSTNENANDQKNIFHVAQIC